MYYSISEISELLGVPASTLRFYDKKGMLPFLERSSGGIRRFTESDLEWLKIIECLKKTGMPLADIKKYIYLAMEGESTLRERHELIHDQLGKVKRQIEELNEMKKTLEYKDWYYQTSISAGTCSVHNGDTVDDIPEAHRQTFLKLKNMI